MQVLVLHYTQYEIIFLIRTFKLRKECVKTKIKNILLNKPHTKRYKSLCAKKNVWNEVN